MIFSSRLISHSRSFLFATCSHRCFSTSRSFSKSCDPLRILFCGSDDFSIASLHALNRERIEKSDAGIESIDVACRPGKRTGRGLKKITHPPIHDVADEIGLKLHEIDTFTKWTPPRDINLVVAVSFGLLVPPRILQGAKYGGLNVHPSLLPDLRGAAPLHWTLLHERRYTGVSVQTLHPTKFDHGKVLAQTALPGVEVPEDANVKTLENILAPMGAELLLQAIRERRFVEPVEVASHSETDVSEMTDGKGIQMAPKITAQDRRINWDNWSNDDLLRRDRVLGSLHDTTIMNTLTGKPARLSCENWSSECAYEDYTLLSLDDFLTLVVPIREFSDSEGFWRIDAGKPAQLGRYDRPKRECGVTPSIFCSDMTIEGKPKHGAGRYFTEWVRKRPFFGEDMLIHPGEVMIADLRDPGSWDL